MVLRVTVVELPSRWGEPSHAVLEVDAILATKPVGDLVLLPEASLTGYVSPDLEFDLAPFAEPIDGPTANALAALAKKYETHLFGPLVLEEDGHHYNATVGFSPRGEHLVTYRKRHPWIPEEWASPGQDPYPLVDVANARVTIACCFDVHFLEDEAKDTLDAADLLLFPSAWVEETDTRPRRLRSIARKHQVAVAAANWAPGHLLVPGQGGSCVIDRGGKLLAKAGAAQRRIDAELEV